MNLSWWGDETRTCNTEWSESEREKQISYINAHIWNLEKWYWWTYFQGRKGDADIENGLADTVGKGGRGTNGDGSTDMCIHILPCVKTDSWWEAAWQHSVMT